MLKRRSLYAFIYSLLVCVHFYSCKTQAPSSQSLKQFLSYPLEKAPLISIHRGGGETPFVPENCIESFSHFAEVIPALIECDVAMSKDSVLFMMHDKTLDRTTTGTGVVSEKNWSYVEKLSLKDNHGNVTSYKVPTLEDVLQWAKKNDRILTLDIKKSTPVENVITLVQKLKCNRNVVMITYNANEAKEVFDLDPALKISVGIMQPADYDRLKVLGIPDANMIAFIGTREPREDIITFLHQRGIATILGTLGNLDKKALNSNQNLYKKWSQLGVDIFATDYPIEAYESIWSD